MPEVARLAQLQLGVDQDVFLATVCPDTPNEAARVANVPFQNASSGLRTPPNRQPSS